VFRIRIHFIRIRIQYFRLNTDPDLIRIQDFDDQKLKKCNAEFFYITTALSLGLYKIFPSYQKKPSEVQTSKENIQHFKT
jgi:hypothetical protein